MWNSGGQSITINAYKRIIYNLKKGIPLDEKQNKTVDKIVNDMDKNLVNKEKK